MKPPLQHWLPRPGTCTTNGMGMTFAWMPAGTFVMGSPFEEEDRRDDECPHRVALTAGFFISIHPITLSQFARFVSATGYLSDAERKGGAYCWLQGTWKRDTQRTWKTPGMPQADDHPITCISWHDVLAFCTWLTQQDRNGPVYRVPSEAEWEYACRAGTTTAWHWGNQARDGQGWCNVADRAAESFFPGWEGADWDSGYPFTSPVGAFHSNPWGLFDMHGNVWEWCQDWYGPYPEGDARDPSGPVTGQRRVIRGGSWHHVLARCRSAARFKFEPDYCNVSLGGRVCYSARGDSP